MKHGDSKSCLSQPPPVTTQQHLLCVASSFGSVLEVSAAICNHSHRDRHTSDPTKLWLWLRRTTKHRKLALPALKSRRKVYHSCLLVCSWLVSHERNDHCATECANEKWKSFSFHTMRVFWAKYSDSFVQIFKKERKNTLETGLEDISNKKTS